MLVSYSYFSAGGLSNTDIRLLWLPGAIILLGFSVSLACSGKIRLLCLGDDLARSLGVRVGRVRMLCLICASASAAAVVSLAGLLGFVGPDRAAPRPQTDGEPHGAAALGLRADG